MSKTDVSRRGLLKTSAVAGAGLAVPTIFTAQSAAAFTNNPTGGTVTLGFNVPQTGPYADEGADELRAYQLAVEHLNGEGDGGMLNTFSSKALEGSGIMGKKVEYVTGDTQTKSDAARASAKSMIEKDGAIMITGGSSSGVAVAVQGLCQEAGVIFMAGLTHSNDTTGKDKKANGFRHFFNAYMSGAALAPVLKNLYGDDRKAYHLTADYTWGWTQEESIKAATEALGWETVNTVKTPLAATDFSSYIAPVLNSGADVLVLNHYGGNMVNSLTNAVQFGLREKEVNGKNFEIVVPLYSRLMAKGAGENVKGIHGSTNWHWSLQDEGSKAFVRSFGTKYGFPPSQAAHTCYVQTLLYADAVQRAGSFNPCAVAEALEDFEFDGMGNGKTLYRGEDHQCFKDVLVVRGKENPTSEFDLLEVVEVTPRAQVEYPADHPMFAGGQLGSCNPGA
ncbi:Branched-chain amino acid ABC transporter, periplasmic substrate- binding protein [Tritonibacter mobilis]|jgi:ABC-type branched-subunit amino acid transport system substrate-binding protein|uniref:Branched-chain amino acid ABC transporter substrate-binding protein n=1 Tax=Tritonibacter mobilis F1926 TaxID=1265309 RepID=A0A1B1A160_9RHOB|nr:MULTISPECIES: substrate-binding protein [Tritonibacter]EEW59903.1 twin-arginine translocation pathway signal [Ruegeria sp. TrichCH4B]MBW3242770.1 ABC transporter substrate-binding protein [Epibacterium sp. DP7N7-1]NKX73422.1 ABC transporter substrate-binding protein [Rhodobacteraceae bacterium R_SAG3]ANP40319.1 branched-chain amino acid ABC transporter substrate-binding protein [Tritonibacter mobilis F1926]KJZ25316.1 branched-chain amino acid ABC transporter substrate-binding protein [Trito